MKLGSYLPALLIALVSMPSFSYVTCESYVKEILPHKNGTVWIELSDGTKVVGRDTDDGLDRNVSVAIASLMANKKVRILLNDDQSCGVNSQENWSYIMAFKQ